jgi:hypothetical protein
LSRGFTKVIAQAMEDHPELEPTVVPVGLNYTSHMQARSAVHMVVGRPLPVRNYFAEGKIEANRLRDDVSNQMKGLITHVEEADRYDAVIRDLNASATDFTDPAEANRRIALIEQGVPLPAVKVVQSGAVAKGLNFLVRLLHLPVILAWRKLRQRIADPAFVGSIRFGFAVFSVPLYYLVVLICLIPFLGWWAVSVPVALAISALMVRSGK